MNVGRVSGGTNAGWRKTAPQPKDWVCPSCGKRLKRFWKACPVDNAARPD